MQLRHAFSLSAIAALGVAAALALMPPGGARAEEEGEAGARALSPVTDATTQTECSACHMAYPAGLLPASSWKAIMAGLGDHFGENASLDAATAATIEAYLTANAAPDMDAMRDADGGTAKRISDTRWWIADHRGEISANDISNPRVGSKANCVACHIDAAKGIFEDD